MLIAAVLPQTDITWPDWISTELEIIIFLICIISTMKALTASLLVCAMMALTTAADVSINGTMSSSEGLNSISINMSSSEGLNYTANSPCPGGWDFHEGRCFIFIPGLRTWAHAEIYCQSLSANLASVGRSSEYRFIQGLIISQSHKQPEAWLGGSNCEEEEIWLWSDGKPFNSKIELWCPGQPDNKGGHQHCLQMNHGDGKCWDDVDCSVLRPSVCAKRM